MTVGATTAQKLDQARQLHLAGKWFEAEAIYLEVLKSEPENPEALNLLGALALQVGKNELAEKLVRQSLAIRPQAPNSLVNLGVALSGQNRMGEAVEAHQQALRLRAGHPLALYNLAGALHALDRWDESIECYRQLLAAQPNHAEATIELGREYHRKGDLQQADDFFRRGISLNPSNATLHNNLGNIFYNLGEFDRAEASWRRAIELKPDFARAHAHLGLLLLTRGDFESAWPEYDWRWKIPFIPVTRRFTAQMWNGEDLHGKRILIWGEQGFGDALQFVRYFPQVAQRGGKIVLAVFKEQLHLLSGLPGVEQCLVIEGEVPPHDVHCSLPSLPGIFKTTLASIPQDVPYLAADPARVVRWRDRLPRDRFKIGLSWAGRPDHENDRNRTMKLRQLSEITKISGVWLTSLQKGEGAKQLRALPEMEIADWAHELNDFSDTAALVANLDLVISVDTAVVHLAGAMGKPVWVLLPFVPDWRWLLNRTDSPWYPTLRLFRQPKIGDWTTVIAQVVQALTEEKTRPTANPPRS
jgi:tetratricopeptide (TPR) repeat protein